MIELRGVQKSYKIGDEQLTVLKGVSANIQAGSFVALVGPSGCGKSTLLNLLGGLDRPDAGEILFEGQNVSAFQESQLEAFRLAHIGTIFQSFNLIAHMNAVENVEVPLTLAGVPAGERRARAMDLLAMVDLADRADHLPNQLSGGQKQRVAIARSLALQPTVILADEPTGALDSKTGAQIIERLKDISRQQGTTIIMVTHSPEIAAEADHIITMRDGEIIDQAHRNERTVQQQLKAGRKHKTMSVRTAMRHATANLFQKKWRTLLVSVGASIGITGIALMVGLGMGLQDKLKSEIEGFMAQDAVTVYQDADHKKALTDDQLQKVAALPQVKGNYQSFMFGGGLIYGDKQKADMINSLTPDAYQTKSEKTGVLAGHYPENEKEIALSKSTIADLIGKDHDPKEIVGKEVHVMMQSMSSDQVSKTAERHMVVSGVLKDGPFGTANNLITEALARTVAKEIDVKGEMHPDKSQVILKSVDDVATLKTKVEGFGFFPATDSELMDKINSYAKMIQAGLGFFAGISLIVSSIMIGIVLYISVLERTKEIGILRALGGRRKDIRRVFLTEAGVIGTVAGAIGVLVAGGLGIVGNKVLGMMLKQYAFDAFTLPIGLAAFCLLFSALLALFAGWVPAWRAAKLNPIEALRHE